MTCIFISFFVAFSALSFTRYPFALRLGKPIFEAVLDSNLHCFCIQFFFLVIMYIYCYNDGLCSRGPLLYHIVNVLILQ